MKRVLITGGTGFIGRNVIPFLQTRCEIYTPNRSELNLYNQKEVVDYIIENGIDIVFHCANPNPVKNVLDHASTQFEDSIRMFLNLYSAEQYYEMMYTLGSGAEYNKSMEIASVREDEEFRSVPADSYGLAKYTMNQMISKSEKQCNLRLFGCYGPTDHESKFITHAIRCCLRGEAITIRQNCMFDYMQVADAARVMAFFIDHTPIYRSYNVCSGKRVSLLEIAETVKRQMNAEVEIRIMKEGWNREYTACNARLLSEYPDLQPTSLEEGISIQIESERKNLEARQ